MEKADVRWNLQLAALSRRIKKGRHTPSLLLFLIILFPLLSELADQPIADTAQHQATGNPHHPKDPYDGIIGSRGKGQRDHTKECGLHPHAQDMVPGLGSCMITVFRHSTALDRPSSMDIKLSSCSMDSTLS